MEKNNSFKEIWKALKKSKRILIGLHPRPDGDSFGSCAAMKYILERNGADVKLVSKDEINKSLKAYSFNKEVEYGADIEKLDLGKFDCILFLDHGSLYDYSEEFRQRLKRVLVINIDHHATNPFFGSLNYVNPSSPSSCSIIYELVEKIRFKFDRELSLRLLIGICTDTAFFIHGNSLDSLKKAAKLIEIGKINYRDDLYNVVTDHPWNLKKLHGLLLINMKKVKINDKTVGYSWATKKEYEKLGLNRSDIRLGIVCMQDIKDLDLVFTLIELDDEIKGSFRSRNFDTTIYSSVLEGGGHKGASGFRVKNMNMKKAIEKVLKTIEEKGFVEVGNEAE